MISNGRDTLYFFMTFNVNSYISDANRLRVEGYKLSRDKITQSCNLRLMNSTGGYLNTKSAAR